MLDSTAFYRDLLGPAATTIPTIPMTGVVVRETAHTGRHATRRRVIFLTAQTGNARHGNRYTEQAVRALVQEIQRHPKVYMGHATPASIHAGTERHVGDMAGVAVRETVHYDPTLKAVVGEVECTPDALALIDLTHAAGDTIGVSIEAVGEPATFGSHDVVGWRNYRGACLVPEGGAGGMTVREAASGAVGDAEYNYGYGETTTVSTDFRRDLSASLAQAAARAAAVRESAGLEDEGAAAEREVKADLRTRYHLNDDQAGFVLKQAWRAFENDPYGCESFDAVVTREANAYADTLPEPLGREGSVRFFDALVDARNGR